MLARRPHDDPGVGPQKALKVQASSAVVGTSHAVSGIAPALQGLAGDDPRMRRLLQQASRLAGKALPLLIEGETGTGKEVLARALHAASGRAKAPFVAINCAALPESLIESELFGYAAGTFTGARANGMPGLITQAQGGTLFLDEIGDMPLLLQTRLLRVLSEREITPLGARQPLRLDIAIIAASHHHLVQKLQQGLFREDLYYRLCGVCLSLPPLRERQDLPFLIDHIFREESTAQGGGHTLSTECVMVLRQYGWPGNLRQLRNVLRAAIALSQGGIVTANDLPGSLLAHNPSLPRQRRLASQQGEPPNEHERLLSVLQQSRWCISLAARKLGVCRSTVYRRMQRLQVVPPNWRG